MTTKRIAYISGAAIVLAAIAVGAWLLFAPGSQPTKLSAAVLYQQACDTLAEIDHDVKNIVTNIDDRVKQYDASYTGTKSVQTMRFSGPDAHMTVKSYFMPGDVFVAKGEHILKDGVWYAREVESSNQNAPYGAWEIWAEHYPFEGSEVPCFGTWPSDAIRGAADEVQGVSEDDGLFKFTVTETLVNDILDTTDYWVDSTGRPVRSVSILTEPSGASGVLDADRASSSDTNSDASQTVIAREETTFSGFGEPNVITAPIDPPAKSLSIDSTLLSLSLSGVTLVPAFWPFDEEYTASVASDVDSTTVTATAMDAGASYVVKLGGVEDADGTVDLAVGKNVITVVSTSESGTVTDTYTVTVTRAGTASTPEISITGGSGITEGGSASFTVTASPAPSAALSVSVAVTASGDYGVTTGTQTVTIPTTGSATLTVATTGDSVDEADGSVTATLKAGTGYTVSDTAGAATVAVKDDDDPPADAGPVVSISAGRDITEGGWAAFTLTVKPRAALDVTVTVSQSGEHGVKTGSRTVSIPARGSAKMEVSTQDDGVDEANGSVTVTVKDGTGYTVSASKGAASVTVKDNDEPSDLPQLTIADASASESAGAMVFVVTLNKASDETVTVEYQVAGGTATRRVDYEGKSGVLTFAPGETRKEIKAAVYDDSNVEGDETAEARLLWYPAPKGAIFADMLAEGVIVDDD